MVETSIETSIEPLLWLNIVVDLPHISLAEHRG